MAVATTVRRHTDDAFLARGALSKADSFALSLRRAKTAGPSIIDDEAMKITALLPSRRRQTERRPLIKELEALASREGASAASNLHWQAKAAMSDPKCPEVDARTSVTRNSHTRQKTGSVEERSGGLAPSKSQSEGKRRQPGQEEDLREAAKQLAMATMECEKYMQGLAANNC